MTLRIACDLDGTLADMERALQHEAERLFGPDVDLRARGHVVLRGRSDHGEETEVHVQAESTSREEGRQVPDVGLKPDATKPDATLQSASPEVRLKPDTTVADAAAGDAIPKPDAAEDDAGGRQRRPLSERQMRELWAHVRGIDNFWTTLKEIEPGKVSELAALAAAHRWEVLFLTQRPATAGDTAQVQSQAWLHEHGFRFPSVYVMSGSRGKVADALRLDAVVDDRPENCLDVVTDSSARAILVWREEPALLPAAASRLGITVVPSFAEALAGLQQLMAKPGARGLIGRLRAAIGV